MELPFNGLATIIGSLPHPDAVSACQEVILNLKDIPAWPQLPRRSFKENMYAQFSEHLPGLVLDLGGRLDDQRSREPQRTLGMRTAAERDEIRVPVPYAH